MKKLALLAALLPFAACGCPPQPSPPSPVADAAPAPVAEAGPSPSTDACGRGEAQLLALGCKDSRGRLLGGPNLHGIRWAELCRQNAAAGVPMQPACIATRTSCAEVELCR